MFVRESNRLQVVLQLAAPPDVVLDRLPQWPRDPFVNAHAQPAVAEADVTASIARARRSLDHINQRAEHAYRITST